MTEDFIKRFLSVYFKEIDDVGFILPQKIFEEEDPMGETRIFITYNNMMGEGDLLEEEDLIYVKTSGEFEGHPYDVEWGATKFCFIFHDFKEVIKISFNGYFCLDGLESEEEEPIYLLEEEFGTDYNQVEERMYEKASEDYKKILLKTDFVCKFGGLRVYKQEKIKETYSDAFFKSERIIKSVRHYEDIEEINSKRASLKKRKVDLRRDFAGEIIDLYGKQPLIDMEISDLHEGNYGYTFEGKPVIFDYAGF